MASLDAFGGNIAKESWKASRKCKTTTLIKAHFDWIYGRKPSYISDVPGGKPEAGIANRAQKKVRNTDSTLSECRDRVRSSARETGKKVPGIIAGKPQKDSDLARAMSKSGKK